MTRRRKLTDAEKTAIVERQDAMCACGCEEFFVTGERVEFDHEIPLHLGGADTLKNTRALKQKHHLRKTVTEAKIRAKVARIKESAGLTRKRPNAKERYLARRAQREAAP